MIKTDRTDLKSKPIRRDLSTSDVTENRRIDSTMFDHISMHVERKLNDCLTSMDWQVRLYIQDYVIGTGGTVEKYKSLKNKEKRI